MTIVTVLQERDTATDITLRTRLLTGHWWGKAEPVHLSAILWAPGVERPGRIRNVTFARLRVEGEHGGLQRGEDAVVRDSRAAGGTDTFLEMVDVKGRRFVSGNDTRAARRERPGEMPPASRNR